MNWPYIWKTYKIPIIAVLCVLIILVGLVSAFTCVKTGSKTVCRYDAMVLKDDTHYVITFRWNAWKYDIKIIKSVCPKHKKLEALYRKAKKALKDGRTDDAKKIFEQIRTEDSGFLDVNTELARMDEAAGGGGSSSGGGTDPGGGGGGTPPPPPPPVDLLSLLPSTLSGYTAGPAEKFDSSAQRSYTPKSESRVKALLVVVHQTSGQSASEQFVANVDKAGFPEDGRVTTVNGYAAYFGTDGTTYATLAWAKVNVVFEVQMHSSTGNPAELYDDTISVAGALK